MEEKVNKGGKPPVLPSPEEMLRLGLEFFKNEDKPTITGLCLHLGFESRQSFYDYEKRQEYSYTVKRLRLMIENKYEKRLDDRDYATAGVVFALKNLGWSDRQEIDHTTQGKEIGAQPTKIVFKNFKEDKKGE